MRVTLWLGFWSHDLRQRKVAAAGPPGRAYRCQAAEVPIDRFRIRVEKASLPRRDLVQATCLIGMLLGSTVMAAPYEAIAVSNGGTIEGVVKVTSAAPAVPPIKATKNQEVCGNSIPNPLYEVGPNMGVKNVEVYIKSIEKGKPNPTGSITLINKHCMFEPRVQGASVGQRISIGSSDPILHNTHPQVASTNATLFNVALPFKGYSVVQPLPSVPELIHVRCDVHQWMFAWIWEFDHPYYATTDANGHFRITDVPPGTYTVVAWHEVMGQKEASATVVPGKPVNLDFSFTPKE